MFALIDRLIFLLVAISAIRSGILFLHRLAVGQHRPQSAQVRRPPPPAATMLQQDPVCGTYVAVETSLKRICHGKVVHFCSPECRDRYQA